MVNGIVISSSNVLLDLNDSIINGTGGSNGIVVNSGRANITIRNGTISNMVQNGILINGSTQLLTIDSIYTFSNNVGIAALGATQGVISNCTAAFSKGNGFAFTQVTGLINQNCIVKNCVSLNNLGNGFSFNNCFNFQVINATANTNRNNGFLQFNGDKISYTECVANNNTLNGFSSAGTSNIFNYCIAAGNIAAGFLVLGSKCDINNCEANTNGEGFQINNINNSVLQCISKNNVTNGFNATANSSQAQIRGNTATANNIGFLNSGTVNKFYSNFANANVTDYSGITNFFVSPTVLSPINFTANIAE